MWTAPRVSVCVPTYNYARFLPDCLDSVLRQTFEDWELIVCDDASTDGTEEVVRRYTALDSRIRYVRNERNLGMNPNIARAASLGTGTYLKILCADDFLAPRCLEVMHGLMEANPSIVLGTSAEFLTDEDGTPERVQFLFGEPVSVVPGEVMLDRMAAGEGFGGNSSFFIRRSAYERVGGYDGATRYAGDYELASRLCRVGAYLHTDQPLFYGRRQPASSSSNDPGKLVDVVDWFKIPDKAFHPRPVGSREWRRYQRLTGMLTARYLLNTVTARLRGRADYASSLAQVLRTHGNFRLGIPWLPAHVAARLMRRLTGRHLPRFRSVETSDLAPQARNTSAGILV